MVPSRASAVREGGGEASHFSYYAVPDNSEALFAFRYQAGGVLAALAIATQPAHPRDLGVNGPYR